MGATLLKAFERVLEFFCTVFALVLGALILLMCVDIAIRNFRIGSLPWLIELTEYAMYAGTFLAAPWVLRLGSHVRVDALLTAIPKKAAVRMEQLVDAVGFAISLVLVYFGALAVLDAWNTNLVARKTWNFDEWLLLLPIPISGVLLAAEFVLRIARVRGVVADAYDRASRASI
ncbi:MAG TPA: TRAP transporter small permease [Alphaproteobacteria bacterium]|jgi:TRAP-type C4-dicarboxylate transport system permease small subunit